MEQWIAWLAALVSFSAFLVLWFREVRRVLRSLKSIVDSALEHSWFSRIELTCLPTISSVPAGSNLLNAS